MHKVPRPSVGKYSDVCGVYVGYVAAFGRSTVVFDGYEKPSTKDEAHMKRRSTVTSVDLNIENDNPFTQVRDRVLSNETNKKSLIALLSGYLRDAGVPVLQASGDADTLIVRTAISHSLEGRNAVVVGEDTDLLVLLAALSPSSSRTFMHMPGRSGAARRVFDVKVLQDSLGDLKKIILFYHAFTGCDTTSAPYMRGKVNSWKKFEKCDDQLKKELQVFYQPDSSHEEIARVGEEFMLQLYKTASTSSATNLNELRLLCYQRAISRKSPGDEFHLASLPPTSAATRQHSYRVYYQVQDWLGNTSLTGTEWGWKLQHSTLLRPVTTDKAPGPEDLIHLVFCNCPMECGENCDCRTGGIPCGPMCGHCGGTACDNMDPDRESDDEDIDDPEETL